MNSNAAMLTGVGVGAALAYLLDPATGRRRRAMMRQSVTHAARKGADAVGATSRDLANRTRGLSSVARRPFSGGVSDDVLVARVRSRLGRYTSHPHAIEVTSEGGRVTLRGPILAHEADGLLHAVRRVRGVDEALDALERHEQAGNVPALQGGSSRPGERWALGQESWAPTTRLLVGVSGLSLIGAGMQRRDWPGAALSTAGALLMARAITDIDVPRLVGAGGGRRAVDIQKTLTIKAPVADVFAFWLHYENFPRFMSHVREVHATHVDGQSHWIVDGPAGVPVEFDAQTTQFMPNEVIAWKTAEGATVAHAGLVRFEPVGNDATRLTVRFSYNPPAGVIGHAAAWLLGADAKRLFDDDLARLKTLIETGHPPHDAAQRAEAGGGNA